MNYLSLYTMPSLKDITNDYMITENDISTEWFNLKDLIKRLKDLVLKIKNFIKNVIRKAIAGFKVIFHKLFGAHKQIEKIVEVADPVDLVAVTKKVLASDLGRTKFILNKDTSLINIDTFNKFADHVWERIVAAESGEEIASLNIDPEDPNASYGVVDGEFNFRRGNVIEDVNWITKITEKDIKELLSYRQIKRFSIDISEKGYPDLLNKNDKMLDEYLRDPNLSEEEARDAIELCRATFNLQRARIAVAHSVLGLYRGLYSELRKGSVFNTPVPKNLKLVHLSTNGDLNNILYPRQPQSLGGIKEKYVQILPKRISFSPTIEKAMFGIPMAVLNAPQIDDDTKALDVFVYEPVIEKDTMMIKEKYMKTNVSEWKYSNEVAITTPVKVKKTAMVRIYLEANEMEDVTLSFGGIHYNWMNALRNIEVLKKY